MSKTIKIINVIVAFVWAALIAILLYRNYAGVRLETTHVVSESFKKATYWYDVYVGTHKVGVADTTIEQAANEIIVWNTRNIKVEKEGEKTRLIQELKYLCNTDFTVKSFDFTMHFDDEDEIKVNGTVEKGEIIYFLESGGKRKTGKIPSTQEHLHLPVTLVSAIAQRNPAVKSAFLVPVLNLVDLSVNNVKVTLEEIRPLKVGLRVRSLHKFSIGGSTIWTNENGIILKEILPKGVVLYSQYKSLSEDPSDRIIFDLTALPYIRSDRIIYDPEKITTLRLKIGGFDMDPSLYENSTTTLKRNILTIKRVKRKAVRQSTYTLPSRNKDTRLYLSPDRWVRSNLKPLKNTAAIYARSFEYDAYLLSSYLTSYVFKLIRSEPIFFLADTKGIMNLLSGDDLGRTVMFASYARAAGLPTRLVGGLVYRNGSFYFHTWPEVLFDAWIPVDPSFNQFPADATHVPLIEGDLQEIVSIINKLENVTISVLEVS